ncbi:MAG: hypothetical protein A2138_22785 [Deltaproteobacteria bacterium RBG_16_71_12]|nr:MAG: hypothetical protein A2138_22785 [Deltaproteobacteria bacterium RBG_16_71_12]
MTRPARPITKLRLVLPPGRAAAEAVAARLADALALHGVQVRQQLLGAPPDGAPRADVALWLPDGDGATPAPDARAAPARVHVALVIDPSAPARSLARYDALFVPHESLVAAVEAAQKRGGARERSVQVARLAGDVAAARDAEKALRGAAGRAVVVVDARGDFESDIERTIVQLALKAQPCTVVLLAPHDERSRARVRALADTHGVDAFLASGPDGLAQSIAAADLFLGRPAWDELLLLALHRTAVTLLPQDKRGPLLAGLVAAAGRPVEELLGLLQLAAALDRMLGDPGALSARGLALHEALFQPERALLDQLAAAEPLPHGAAALAAWEPVGPHAHGGAAPSAHVEAREAGAQAEPTRAQKIEDALSALKAKIATGGAP